MLLEQKGLVMSSTETQGIVARPDSVELNADTKVSVEVLTVEAGKGKSQELAKFTTEGLILLEGVQVLTYEKEDGTVGKFIAVVSDLDFEAEEVMPPEGSKAPAKTPLAKKVYQSTNKGYPGFQVACPNTGEVFKCDLEFKCEVLRWLSNSGGRKVH